MFEKIRKTLSAALDALEGDPTVSREELDRVLAAMRRELVEARARLAEREEEVAGFERRLAALRERGDVDAAQLAELEAGVVERRAELEEHRRVVSDLTSRFKEAVKQRDVLPEKDRRARASETVREAARDELDRLERLEEDIEREGRELAARREVEDALEGGPGAGRSAGGAGPSGGARGGESGRAAADDREFREAEAAELLEELKRRMGMDPGSGR